MGSLIGFFFFACLRSFTCVYKYFVIFLEGRSSVLALKEDTEGHLAGSLGIARDPSSQGPKSEPHNGCGDYLKNKLLRCLGG